MFQVKIERDGILHSSVDNIEDSAWFDFEEKCKKLKPMPSEEDDKIPALAVITSFISAVCSGRNSDSIFLTAIPVDYKRALSDELEKAGLPDPASMLGFLFYWSYTKRLGIINIRGKDSLKSPIDGDEKTLLITGIPAEGLATWDYLANLAGIPAPMLLASIIANGPPIPKEDREALVKTLTQIRQSALQKAKEVASAAGRSEDDLTPVEVGSIIRSLHNEKKPSL